jgi:hypothetical protein
MMPDQSMFSDVAPLSKEAHGDWSLQREGGYGFARQMSAVPLVLREMAAAAREFPVAFAREGDGIKLFAVLGLKKGENLFVQADGRWDGGYVPAGLRQYPFVIGRVKDSDRALLSIDQGYAGFNRKGEGEALFGENGEVCEFVAKVRDFAEELAKSSALTERFCKTLADLDVLSPMRITLAGPDGEKREIDGLRTVDRDKLKALPGDKVKELLESNSMELIFLHLQSLGNLRSLASRIFDRISKVSEDYTEQSRDEGGIDLNVLLIMALDEMLTQAGKRQSEFKTAKILDAVLGIADRVDGAREIAEDLGPQRVGMRMRGLGFKKSSSHRLKKSWVVDRHNLDRMANRLGVELSETEEADEEREMEVLPF